MQIRDKLYHSAEQFIKTTLDLPGRLVRRISFDGKCGLEDTVLLACMGRSGSTFVSNIINYDRSCRIMFEPFRFDRVHAAREFVFPLYLRPDNADSRYLSPAHKILSGRIHSRWIDREDWTLFPTRRLIKDIRINLFLKWIHQQFPELRIILLIRHPCAVVESWIAVNFGDGSVGRERLFNNTAFTEDTPHQILEAYQKADTSFERLVFLWCIFNWVPLQQFKSGLHIIFYEDLISNPHSEIKNLFSFMDRSYDEKKVVEVMKQPSSTIRNNTYFRTNVAPFKVNKWEDKVSRIQIDKTYEIMSLFGMDTLYDSVSFKPNKESMRHILKNHK